MSEADLQSLIGRYFDQVWNQGNLGEIDGVVAENVVRHSPARADISGREALRQAIAQALAAFPERILTVESITAVGDRIVVRWVFQGTHRAEFLGIAATGRFITIPGTTILRRADNEVVEIWDIYDPDSLWQQLGQTPATGLGTDQAVVSTGQPAPPHPSRRRNFASVAPAMIGLATLTTILVYLFVPHGTDWTKTSQSWFAVGSGLAAGAGVLVFARLFHYPRMSHRFLAELKERWSFLDARVHACCLPTFPKTPQSGAVDPSVNPESGVMACSEAVNHHNEVKSLLGIKESGDGQEELSNGTWAAGTEYLDALKRLHRADEALMIVIPTDQVIEASVTDELRLIGSNIENNDQLLLKLRHAVVTLGGADYLAATPPAPSLPKDIVNDDEAKRKARAVLRDIRNAINSYRDGRRDGMVRTRDLLTRTGTMLAGFAYVTLMIAIIRQVGETAIVAAVAFFVAGAMISLFSQLSGLFSNDIAAEDCGLGRSRLIYTPVLSGLAGIGGVVVTAMLFGALNGDMIKYPSCALYFPEPTATATETPNSANNAVVPTKDEALGSPEAGNATGLIATETPTASATATATATPTETATATATVTPTETPTTDELCVRPNNLDPPSLSSIFDLSKNEFGIIIAAIFGLVPGLLVQRLLGEVKRYQDDLHSTTVQGKG